MLTESGTPERYWICRRSPFENRCCSSVPHPCVKPVLKLCDPVTYDTAPMYLWAGRYQLKSSTESHWTSRSRSVFRTRWNHSGVPRANTLPGIGSLQQSATPTDV